MISKLSLTFPIDAPKLELHYKRATLSQATDQQATRSSLQGHVTLFVLWFAGGETRLAQLPHEIIETILLTVAVCSGMSVRELDSYAIPKSAS